jgi:hypothetical protein
MKRRGLQVTDHAATRWVQRARTDPGRIPQAWRQAIYVGHLAQVRRLRHHWLLGYRWAQWVLVVSHWPASGGHRERWVLVSVWPVAWWNRAEAHSPDWGGHWTARRDRMKIQRRTKEE